MKNLFKLLLLCIVLSLAFASFASCGSIPVESLVLSNTSLTLDVGEVKAVNCTVLPEDASDKTVTWTSSNSSVATVNNVGVISAIGSGSCIITASSANISSSITVTVKKPVEELVLNKSEVILKEGESFDLICTIVPNDASEKKVNWNSSDNSVATVNQSGKVTGIKPGNCTVKATCDGIKISANITVKQKGPDFKKLYNELSTTHGWSLGSDNSYLSADTNVYNSDDYNNRSTLSAIENMNKKIGLPDSLYNDMIQTTWSMGKQKETFENLGVEVTWTYHPDKGLEVTYKLINP